MPSIPTVTKNFMLACVAALCISLFFNLNGLFGLWSLNSGNFWPWQIATYAFLHASVAHLIFNMLGLWMFGAELENYWGRRRYIQFGLVSALTAALVQLLVGWLMGSRSFTVGASGILMGLLMAYALTFPRRSFDLVGFLPMLLMLLPFPMFNIVGMVLFFLLLTNRQMVPIPPIQISAMTMVSIYGGLELLLGSGILDSLLGGRGNIAHFAHLGGMLGGWLMIRYWRKLSPFSSRRR